MLKQNRKMEFEKMIKSHPCFSQKAQLTRGRIHLPVAPKCNIRCNYCERVMHPKIDRPGITSVILTPEQALEHTKRAISSDERYKVVGIAGPGDPLANPKETFKTFELIGSEFPELIKCTCTNGLKLPEYAGILADLKVDVVTVTLNTVNPKTGSKIYSLVGDKGKMLHGIEGAKTLLQNQLNGLQRVSEMGITTRINTILIPEINMDDMPQIAKTARDIGVQIMNIIPLIPLYNFKKLRRPTRNEMNTARNLSEKYLPQFRWCKQCRADAFGVPGEHDFNLSDIGYGFHISCANQGERFRETKERKEVNCVNCRG